MVDTANVKNWGLSQYYDYLKENADHMDHELYDCMRSYYQSLGDYNNVKRWENAGKENKKLQKACEKFQKNHKKAAVNMESLYVMKCLGEFCGEQAKHLSQLDKMEKSMYPIDEELRQAKYAGEIADAHKEYLSIHMHNEYDASMRKFFNGYENNAYKWNLEDYAKYFKENKGVFSSKLFNNVQEELRKVQEFQDKPINMETTKEMFQQRGELIKACTQYINERSGAATGKGQERLKVVKDLLEFYSESLADKNLDQLRDVHILKTYEGKTWGELDKVPLLTADRSQLGQKVGAQSSERFRVNTGEKDGFFTAREYAKSPLEYVSDAVMLESNPEYKRLMGTVLKKNIRNDFAENFDEIEFAYNESAEAGLKKLNSILWKYAKENTEIYELLGNKEAKKCLLNHIVKGIDKDPKNRNMNNGDELTGRNVATTRMAERLGVGKIVARSEKMNLQDGDKIIKGSYMNFAEGIDVRNGTPESVSKLQGIKLDTPKFMKDACNLDVFDFICAQQDRHGGNIFLKIDENTKQVTGLQGIDNDLSFTNDVGKSKLNSLYFISKDLADQILTLKKDDLEFAVGDILNNMDIDHMYVRITKLQEHIRKNMIQLEDDDWELNKWDEKNKDFIDKLEKMNPGRDLKNIKQKYEEGLTEITKAFSGTGKVGSIAAVFKEVTKRAEIQPIGEKTGEHRNYAEQEKPMDYAEQEKPMDYAEQEKPMSYANQEKPINYAEQEIPMKDIPAKPAAAPARQTVSLNTLAQEDQTQKRQEKMPQGLVADRRAFFEGLSKNNENHEVKHDQVQKMNMKEFEGKQKTAKPAKAKPKTAEAPKKRAAEKAF